MLICCRVFVVAPCPTKQKINVMPVLSFLDFTEPGFSTKSEAVKKARANHWCARTPLGLAILTHEHVGRLLRDRRLRQGSYAWPKSQNASGSFAEFWQRSIISLEGPKHKTIRGLAIKALSEEFVLSLVPQFDEIAIDLCRSLSTKGQCEFQNDFAMPFSGRAICALLNLPQSNWTAVAGDASTLGLAMGLHYKKHEAKINAACDRLTAIAERLIERTKANRSETDLVGRLISFNDPLKYVSHQDLIDIIVIMIFGGVDTTRSQLGFLMALFVSYPEQWADLRKDLNLVPNAIEEAIRAWPTTTWVTRETIEGFEFDGVWFPEGITLHLLVHSSAKDPELGYVADFDIHARQKRHHGFGGGAHHCLGHFVARTDMACALRHLAKALIAFDINGRSVYLPDSGNTSPELLPLKYTFDANFETALEKILSL